MDSRLVTKAPARFFDAAGMIAKLSGSFVCWLHNDTYSVVALIELLLVHPTILEDLLQGRRSHLNCVWHLPVL